MCLPLTLLAPLVALPRKRSFLLFRLERLTTIESMKGLNWLQMFNAEAVSILANGTSFSLIYFWKRLISPAGTLMSFINLYNSRFLSLMYAFIQMTIPSRVTCPAPDSDAIVRCRQKPPLLRSEPLNTDQEYPSNGYWSGYHTYCASLDSTCRTQWCTSTIYTKKYISHWAEQQLTNGQLLVQHYFSTIESVQPEMEKVRRNFHQKTYMPTITSSAENTLEQMGN